MLSCPNVLCVWHKSQVVKKLPRAELCSKDNYWGMKGVPPVVRALLTPELMAAYPELNGLLVCPEFKLDANG